jgi:hypothetical protein
MQAAFPFKAFKYSFVPDVACDFEVDECGFEIVGEGGFLFRRTKGSEVAPDIDSDHSFNHEAYFLYAKWNGTLPAVVGKFVTKLHNFLLFALTGNVFI